MFDSRPALLIHRKAAAKLSMTQPSTDGTSSLLKGLTASEACAKLVTEGANELPGSGARSLPAIAREVLAEPMFLLLLAAAAIYIILGEAREAIALSASIVVVIVITILQERRTEHALARLRDLSDPQARVIREGVQVRIPSREVVVGDVLVVSEGDRIVADAVLLSATALSVDESILTGESLPVDKNAQAEVSTDAGRIYSGSLAVRGFATARVIATGARTEIGKIGHALNSLHQEVTPLFMEVRRIVRLVAGAGLLLCTAIAVFYALSRHDWLGGVLAGITVAMSVLPEEFPVVLTVFLAMGAWRISRQGVLTRRMPAIETIGSATVLAVDKTGTLTENRMRVAVIDSLTTHHDLRHQEASLDELARSVLATALAASERDAFDPMEHAIGESAAAVAPEAVQRLSMMQLRREYDLTPELLAVTHVWQDGSRMPCEVAVKGAPETVFNLCRLEEEQRQLLHQRVSRYAAEGLRVLAVAKGEHVESDLPDSPHGFTLTLLGLICLADPLRADIPANLEVCTRAGIRVVMITGDHAGTALAIANQAGIDTTGGVLTGAEVTALSTQDLAIKTQSINVYARMVPEQKLLLVQAFKDNGEVVVMTGDGVNDAPALKAAHVGVAMGGRGTEVAREAASLVLLNDDFASLVGAVRLGRRIYENIRHAMSFIIAVHIPIAGMGLISTFAGWPLLLYPLHVMFLEFVIDPACSLAFEADPESAMIMSRKPRAADAKLFSSSIVLQSVFRGCVMLTYNIAVYGIALKVFTEEQARALAFMAMGMGSIVLIFMSRRYDELPANVTEGMSGMQANALHWWIAGLASVAMCITVYVPAIAGMFHFDVPPFFAVAAVVLTGLLLSGISRVHGCLSWRGHRAM
jgi:Ca2+-transporting ATPase